MDSIIQVCDMCANHFGAPKVGNLRLTRGWAELALWDPPNKNSQQGEKYETGNNPVALMNLLVEQLAVALSYPKSAAKWLAMLHGVMLFVADL